jgi:hypothetical protein
MFGGSPDSMVPRKFDPRIAAIAVVMMLVGVATLIADRVVFVRAPNNISEKILALPTAFFYKIWDDRFYANLSAALIWIVALFAIGAGVYKIVVQKVIEPMVIKNMIETKRREKELLNKYGDDTL